jgi:hypothetical protein
VSLEEGSIRQRIIKLLSEATEPMTAEDIARVLDIDVSEVYMHLEHVAKTVRRSSGGEKALLMIPPRCRKCGYVFKDLDKPKKPSRCPRCKSEWIEPPRFIIKSVDEV